ncbi:leucine-rich_repeat domain-containing protein [Hexamita inflata]|uniref:Leucine-rich_repeat domain-containing protein n=1 Tax=Hexamita inflata TaxID=28002 RepID=A0ABP1GVA1_9EUKA
MQDNADQKQKRCLATEQDKMPIQPFRFGAELLKEENLIHNKQFIEPNTIGEQKFEAKYEKMIVAKTWITVFNVSNNESDQIRQIQNCYCVTFGRNNRVECDQKDSQTVLNKIQNISATFKVEVEEFRLLQIKNVSELKNLSFVNKFNIQELVLWDCQNVKFLGVENVKVLNANKCNLQSIDGIQNWDQLLELELSLNRLESIAQLENLTQLKVLSLWRNRIQNLEPLRGLVNLTNLQLQENQIGNVEPLRGLVNLTTFWLYQNQIKDFSPIQNHPNFIHYATDCQE